MEQQSLGWAAVVCRREGFWDWARRIDEARCLIDDEDCGEACFALLNTMRGYVDAFCDLGDRCDPGSTGKVLRRIASVRKCIEALCQSRWGHDDESEPSGQDCSGAVCPTSVPDGVLQQGKDFAIPQGEFGGNR